MNTDGFPDYVLAGNGVEIPFNIGTPDAAGSYWYMSDEMQGWDSPDGRVSMLTKIGTGPNADGEIPADEHYRGRTLLFTLYASSSSEAIREASRYLIAQTLDLVGSTGTLTVNEEVPKQVITSRSGNNNYGRLVMTDSGLSAQAVSTSGFPTAAPDDGGNVYVLKVDIELYCADPRKYSTPYSGPTPIESNSITLDNVGNTHSTNFYFLFSGDIAGTTGPLDITLVNADYPDGVTMTLAVPTLPASAPALSPFPTELGINFYLNTINDNGPDNYYYLRNLQTPWLVLAPGENVFTFTPPAGDLDGDATWNSAWI